MVKFKQKPNYGFPLSFIFYRIMGLLFLVFVMLLLFDFSYYYILIISLFVIPVYIFFGVIQSKNNFNKKRNSLLKKCIKIADLKGNEKVLDLGTGSGFLAIGFAKKLKNSKSIGLDKFSFSDENLIKQIINIIKINFLNNKLTHAEKNKLNTNFLK